jgi:hypothetical protein
VQEDRTHPTSSVGRQSDRHFELPRVRELRPEPAQPPSDAEAEDGSSRSSPRRQGRSSDGGDDAALSEPPGALRRDAFQRRWERVQARFVDQAARRADVTDD